MNMIYKKNEEGKYIPHCPRCDKILNEEQKPKQCECGCKFIWKAAKYD